MKDTGLMKILGVVALALLLCSISIPAMSQTVQAVGKTEEQSSQLVLWYDSAQGRRSFLQVTNGGPAAVTLHVQIFQSSGPSSICQEADFIDVYSAGDTHLYDMSSTDILRNDNTSTGISVNNTKGFVVITPVDNGTTRNAVSWQHMFGSTGIIDTTFINPSPSPIIDESPRGMRINAMGRDAVDLTTGDVVPDNTLLDGVAAGFVLIQPSALMFNFSGEGSGNDLIDIVSIAFTDTYSQTLGYKATSAADATWTPLVHDDAENSISCSQITQSCFFDIGLNNIFAQANTLLGAQLLCPGTTFGSAFNIGWLKIAVGGLTGFENEMGVVGFVNIGGITGSGDAAGADWMLAE